MVALHFHIVKIFRYIRYAKINFEESYDFFWRKIVNTIFAVQTADLSFVERISKVCGPHMTFTRLSR